MTADTALPDTRTRQRKRTLSSVSFAVHSACGLWLTILLAIVMVSGTVAVFNAEIDWLIYPELRVTPGEARVNPGAIYDAVGAAYPRFGINSVATGVDRDRLAASAFVLQPGGGARYVWIDQWTGAVRGDTPFMTVGRFFDLLHTTLYLPVIGRAFVNFFGVLLLLSMVTGLIAYKKFWRGFLRRPRFRRGARTWLGDLHRLVAIWTVWFSAIIAVTGMWWFYETPLVTMAGAPPLTAAPERPEILAAELDALGPDTPARLPVARLAERVAEAYPDMRITLIVPPGHAGQPFEFVGDRGEALVLRGGNRVYVNPYSGEIVGSALVETWSAIERIDAAMLPLHYGTWAKRGTADLAVKTVWFLGGAAISFLTFSGLLIYLRRTRRALAELGVAGRLRRRALALWRCVRPWGGPMGAFKYLNVAGVVGIAMGAGLLLSLASAGLGDRGEHFSPRQAGPFAVSAVAVAGLLEADLPPIRPGARVDVYVAIADGRFSDARFIWAAVHLAGNTVGDAAGGETPGALFEGPEGLAHATVRLPRIIGPAHRLTLTIEGWDGRRHAATWPLSPAPP